MLDEVAAINAASTLEKQRLDTDTRLYTNKQTNKQTNK